MNWESPLDIIVNVISAGAFLGFLVFVIVYMTFSNWRATAPGRALMYAVGALDLVVLMNTVHLFAGRYPGIEFVRIPVYSLLLFASWRLVFTLVAILRGGQPITVRSFVEPKAEGVTRMTTPITVDTVPDIWFKAQRVLRTIVAVGIPAILTAATVLPLIIEALGLPADLPLRLWLLAVAGGLTAVAAAITRIMAIPQVNAFLTRFGLGSVPRAVVTGERPEVDVTAISNPEAAASALLSEANRRD